MLTPERIEEIKEDAAHEISEGYGHDISDITYEEVLGLLAALKESQQRIGKLELYVKSLEFNREDTQKRANEKLRERDTKLAEAQQTIARQQEALESARNTMEDALSVGEARYKDFDTRLCPWADLSDGVENIEAALGNKEGSNKA
ncbi:hypothetical protein NST58_06505 [Paenibacillus sp. FSL R10-2796]|uniref:hypothetical protein n=1 Tax=Paenibacillus sp. FSL R10-2796 TaxID=2954663 RepID=UPI0030DD2017